MSITTYLLMRFARSHSAYVVSCSRTDMNWSRAQSSWYVYAVKDHNISLIVYTAHENHKHADGQT